MTEFIFFLTRNDVTIKDAIEVFKMIEGTDVQNIGFKDIGLPKKELIKLRNMILKSDKSAFLEIVSGSKTENINSVKMGLELEVDYIIGGKYVEDTLPLIGNNDVKYFPYVGQIIDHPCLLRGSIEEIVNEAISFKQLGIDGIDLLAYRYDKDPINLIQNIKNKVEMPIIAAGSIDNLDKVRKMVEIGVWGFTIGSAIINRKFVEDGNILDQVNEILTCVRNS